MKAIICALIAALGFAIVSIGLSIFTSKYSFWSVMFWMHAVPTILFAIPMYVYYVVFEPNPTLPHLDFKTILGIAGLAMVLITGVYFISDGLYTFALKIAQNPTLVVMVLSSVPFWTLILFSVWHKEPINKADLLGASLIALGIWVGLKYGNLAKVYSE